jgi:hypothetical protein
MLPMIEPHPPTAATAPPVNAVLDLTARRVRAEFVEMPGLVLTLQQAARFFALTLSDSEQVLSQLVNEHLLFRDVKGAYRRTR